MINIKIITIKEKMMVCITLRSINILQLVLTNLPAWCLTEQHAEITPITCTCN